MRDPQDSTQQVFGPVFVPAKNIPKESWLPLYPDRVLPRTSVLAAAVPFFFFTFALAQLPVPALSWAPNYPDRATVGQTHASRAPSVFYQPALDRFPSPLLAWKGVYPDAARAVPRVPETWITPVLPFTAQFDPASLAWTARYPDSAPSGRPVPAGWYDRPTREPDDLARYNWRGEFPDAIDRLRPQPTGWFVRPLREPDDLARLKWNVVYPDRIDRFRPDGSGWFVRPLREPDDLASYGWRGYQPALINRLRLNDPGQALYTFVQAIVATVPPLAWNGLYPDRALGPAGLHASLQWVTGRNYIPITLNVDQFGWRGVYPEWINRKQTHPAWAPAYFPPATYPTTHPAPFLSWRGVYADRVDRTSLPLGAIPSLFLGRPPIVPFVPAIYPVRLDPARRIILPGSVQPYLIIVAPTTTLDWLPVYLDLMRQRGIHPSQMPCTFRFDFPQRATGAGGSAGWGFAWGGGGAGGSA